MHALQLERKEVYECVLNTFTVVSHKVLCRRGCDMVKWRVEVSEIENIYKFCNTTCNHKPHPLRWTIHRGIQRIIMHLITQKNAFISYNTRNHRICIQAKKGPNKEKRKKNNIHTHPLSLSLSYKQLAGNIRIQNALLHNSLVKYGIQYPLTRKGYKRVNFNRSLLTW